MKCLDNKNIKSIIIRSFQQECNPEEKIILLNWLNENPENKYAFYQAKELFETKNRRMYNHKEKEKEKEKAWDQLSETLKLQEHQPTILRPNSDFKNRFISSLQYTAIILFTCGLTGLSVWYFLNHKQEKIAKLIEIYNTKGVYFVMLPDSSEVWLHRETKLTYPEHFQGKTREIQLEGEAYFKVNADKSRPFIVRTSAMVTRATGTEFNVKAYPEDCMTITSLIEGVVDVRSTNEEKTFRLYPNQLAILSKNSNNIRIQAIEPTLYRGWKEGTYRFRNESFGTIAMHLENMFGVKIRFKNEQQKKIVFSGMFTEEQSIHEVMQILQRSGAIHSRVEGKTIYINTK